VRIDVFVPQLEVERAAGLRHRRDVGRWRERSDVLVRIERQLS
jgi:hypothetical protein